MKIYLAIPYTFDPSYSYMVACKKAAELMSQGHIVFSPISHSHAIAKNLPKDILTDHDFWMRQDLPFIEWADEVHVVILNKNGEQRIAESKGVMAEIARAEEIGRKVLFINQ